MEINPPIPALSQEPLDLATLLPVDSFGLH
jgi:hypothetical protein